MGRVIDWDRLPEFLKPTEVARLLRVEPQTVYRWSGDSQRWPPGTVIRLPGGSKRRGQIRFRKDRLRVLVEKEEIGGSTGQAQELGDPVDAAAVAEHVPELREG